MATVTGFTSTRMLAIENNTVVSGAVVGDDLILTKHDTSTVNAGNVRGPQGDQGPIGEVSTAQMNAAIAAAVNGEANIADGAVTEPKIATGAVTANKLGVAAVTSGKLATDAVNTANVVDGAITGAKIAAATITITNMAANSVGSQQLADDAVDTNALQNDAVTNSKIGNDAVQAAQIADNAVGAAQIAANAVGNSEMADDAINFNEVWNGAAGGSLDGGTIQYCKILGWVFVQGVGVTEATSAGTLPSGYRPSATVRAPMVDNVNLTSAYQMTISTGGVIRTNLGVSNGYSKYFFCFFKVN